MIICIEVLTLAPLLHALGKTLHVNGWSIDSSSVSPPLHRCLGITLSFHRQLSHRSFQTPKWLEYVFAYCGVLAVQGDPTEWVSSHRFHHLHTDTPLDPHSPYEGFWWSHMGWLLDEKVRWKDRVDLCSSCNHAKQKQLATFRVHTSGLPPAAARRLQLIAPVSRWRLAASTSDFCFEWQIRP